MASPLRRPVRKMTPNQLIVGQARYYALMLAARKMKRRTQSLLDSIVDSFLRQQGMLLDPGATLGAECELCRCKLTKNSVSPWMLAQGLWVCMYCFTETVDGREKKIAENRAQREAAERERRGAARRPIPINAAITRG